MSNLSWTVKPVLAAALLAASIGCGSQSSPTAPGSSSAGPSPIPQPASAIVPAANGGVPGVHRLDAVISRNGTATATLLWQDGDYSLQLYVSRGACADVKDLLGGVCTIAGNTRPGERPGVVTSLVTSGDLHTTWVLNPDDAPQPFTLETKIE